VTKKGVEKWCEGQSKHRLGNDWVPMMVQTDYPGGIKAWIENLADGLIQPIVMETDNLLEGLCVIPPPIFRDSDHMRSWFIQIRNQEKQIKDRIESSDVTLNISFPQYTHSCTYPGKCQFWDICWGSAKNDPIGSGLYQLRIPNHPKEAE